MSELLKINVNDHTEKKGGLTYLSWAWAWAEVLKHDPDAEWDAAEYADAAGVLRPCMFMPDGSAIVKTFVTIKGKTKTCRLAVMDNRNNAVKNPDARKVSDATMRCMTKAIAMHGLGLYIYAGEDLPEGDDSAPPAPETEDLPRGSVPQVGERGAPTGVKAAVLRDGGAVTDAHAVGALAVKIEAQFPKIGPARCAKFIADEKLDDMQLVYLSTLIPTTMMNAITRASRQEHANV